MTDDYPGDYAGYINVGIIRANLGQYDKAAEAARRGLKLAPDVRSPYENLAYYNLAQQRPDDAHEILREAQAKKLDSSALHHALYALAFLGKDKRGITQQTNWFVVRPEHASEGLALAADTAAYAGHVIQARDLTKRAVDAALQTNSENLAAIWEENAALREAGFGNAADARRAAEAGLKLAPSSANAEVEAALALAMAGDAARAEELAQDIEKRFPRNTQMQSLWLPAIRAQVALDKGNATEAINDLVPALALELGQIGFTSNLSCLYPTYILGQAYLAAQKGTAAAAEFQKILDHNGVVWNCWTGALAHVGLARADVMRATELEGDDADDARVQALLAYKDFLGLWKDGDPDTPVLKQAKDEFAVVQKDE